MTKTMRKNSEDSEESVTTAKPCERGTNTTL